MRRPVSVLAGGTAVEGCFAGAALEEFWGGAWVAEAVGAADARGKRGLLVGCWLSGRWVSG